MEISEYERVITINTDNFRIGGLALSLVGGFGSLLSGYAKKRSLWFYNTVLVICRIIRLVLHLL